MIGRRIGARLGDNLTYHLRLEFDVLRGRGPGYLARWNATLVNAWLRDRLGRRSYVVLDEQALRARRRSGTVFIFGSGYSLNEISDSEWAHFRAHDVFGFNAFYFQRWIPVDFHILRGGIYGSLRLRPYAEEVAAELSGNPCYEGAVFLLQDDFLGQFANELVGHRFLPRGAPIFRYRTRRGWGPPTRSFSEGVRHVVGTLDDAVNCAYLLGWKEIVLVGVDLYDSRYFHLPPDKTNSIDETGTRVISAEVSKVHGNRYDDAHNTARNGVVQLMAEWGAALAAEGVQLSVYNPRSLLAGVLPVHEREVQVGAGAGSSSGQAT